MDRVLVLGKGFLGKQYEENGYTVIGRDVLDIDPKNILKSLDFLKQEDVLSKYDVIINCIGNANTRQCEEPDQWDDVYAINAELPKHLSDICAEYGKKFVQISSGCVYDKNNEPQGEDEYLSSHCRYVVAKLAGEFNCKRNDLILRPRLYFGDRMDKNNLLCKIQNFTQFLTEINSFTSVQTIVEATTALLENDCEGVFNVSQTGFGNLVDLGNIVGVDTTETINGDSLRSKEGLFLVNNIMDTSKLEQFYTPRDLKTELKTCWEGLKVNYPSN